MRKSEIDFSRYAMAAAVLGSAAAASTASADFSGPYSLNPPANGTYTNPANGTTFGAWKTAEPNSLSITTSVTTTLAPNSLTISLTGNGGPFSPPRTFDLVTSAVTSGTVSFAWSASLSASMSGSTAAAAFVVNGVATNLASQTGPGSSTPSGNFSVLVNAGDTFGFRVAHSYVGTAALTISNFSGPVSTSAVPEGSVGVLLSGGVFALLLLRAQRSRARQ